MRLENELIRRIFCTRNYSHIFHWNTRSFAEHQALGSFYEDIIEELDTFIEQFQGAFGLIKVDLEEEKEEESSEKTPKDILKYLQEDVKWLNENKKELCRGISSLENTFDNITGSYLQTIYKLRFLD